MREGDAIDSLYIVISGRLKVTMGEADGKETILSILSAGEFFGEMGFIWGGELPRHATADAMTDLLLAEFEPDALDAMSTSAQLHLTRALARNLVDRLALANSRLLR